jgi:DNA repair protein RecO (recombination protein O)
MSRSARRVEFTPGFVLHQRPYRDTSLIVEVFTRDYGRLTTFARAARGPRTRFLGLQPFRPLLLCWSGRGEAPTLTAAEGDGPPPQPLAQHCLLPAFYLNELLIRLTVQHDPHPELYAHYVATVARLRAGDPLEVALRQFEKRLLDLLGYGTELAREAQDGCAVVADSYYHFLPGEGVRRAPGKPEGALPGRVLLALAAGKVPEDADGQRQARALLRAALDHCLDGRELTTRTVARAVARMERANP